MVQQSAKQQFKKQNSTPATPLEACGWLLFSILIFQFVWFLIIDFSIRKDNSNFQTFKSFKDRGWARTDVDVF